MDIRASLITEQKSAVFCAGIYAGYRRSALPMPSIVCEGKRSSEGTGHRFSVFSEHGVQQGISRDQAAKRRQGFSSMTERCNIIVIVTERKSLKLCTSIRFFHTPRGRCFVIYFGIPILNSKVRDCKFEIKVIRI